MLTGKQKAAMLLMSLDVATATELLKGVDTTTIQDLAVEATYLKTTGSFNTRQSLELAKEFCDLLQAGDFGGDNFLDSMLRSTVGPEKAEEIQGQIDQLLQKRDPFISVRSAEPQTLASILENEHPQAVAVVLSELVPKKSSEVISLLDEGIRLSAVSRMTGTGSISAGSKARIGQIYSDRLEALKKEAADAGEEAPQVAKVHPLRKVAVILRNLNKELRDGLISAISKKDSEASSKIAELMIMWEDVPIVSDRTMQEALRGIESQQLALALHEVDEIITQKIKSNISERAAATIDEEASLMSEPKQEDIDAARDKILESLRAINEKGELTLVEE